MIPTNPSPKSNNYPITNTSKWVPSSAMARWPCRALDATRRRCQRPHVLRRTMGCAWDVRNLLLLPSGKHTKNYGKWPFIVDFPMKHGGYLSIIQP